MRSRKLGGLPERFVDELNVFTVHGRAAGYLVSCKYNTKFTNHYTDWTFAWVSLFQSFTHAFRGKCLQLHDILCTTLSAFVLIWKLNKQQQMSQTNVPPGCVSKLLYPAGMFTTIISVVFCRASILKAMDNIW